MLAALMRHIVSSHLGFACICLLPLIGSSFAGCVGGVGTTCFQNNECDSDLICCHIGSQFNQGSCETSMVCDELRQDSSGTGGTGGTGGAGGEGGVGGAGGTSGAGGAGGTSGAGGQAGMGGSAGGGGAPAQ